MRKKRKVEEEFFVQKFINYFRENIDENAFEIPEVTDKPDLVISSLGRVIGIELSQFPSRYIIKNFHRQGPAPSYTRDKIEGHLSVYPFEPHRWVYEVLDKKCQKVEGNKRRVRASEMWLVMHCHSTKREWPMSDIGKGKSREAEAVLMRFGARQHRISFDRIFYIYADGTVVDLMDRSKIIPSAVTLPDGSGYPAVTMHHFSFSFDIPLPGLGSHEYYFNDIQFAETIISPMDEWMAGREPAIERPNFKASARVDSERMEWKIFRNGILIADNVTATNDQIGRTMFMHFLLEWSIQETTFTYHIDAADIPKSFDT